MSKPTTVIGAVVLIAGVVLIAVGAAGALLSVTTISTFSQPQSGEYVSTQLMFNSTSSVAVSFAATNGGLIPAQDLNLVNSTNIGQYALTPHSVVNGAQVYNDLMGDYYYVAFGSTQPNTRIVYGQVNGVTSSFRILVLGGILAVIVGVLTIVLGRRRKGRPREEGRTPDMQSPPGR